MAHKVDQGPRMQTALQMVSRFRETGRPRYRTSASNPLGKQAAMHATAMLQYSPAGWPVGRNELADQLARRLGGATLPRQANTSYCGIAAFLYCLLQDRPDQYVAYAIALWTGQPFSFAARPGRIDMTVTAATRHALSTIQQNRAAGITVSELDWMTMASLSGATRGGPGTAARDAEVTHVRRAVTWPSMIMQLFASVGALPRIDSVGNGILLSDLKDFIDLMALWDTHWLVLEIDSSMASGGATGWTQYHWVVVDPHVRPLFGTPKGGPSMTAVKLRERLTKEPATIGLVGDVFTNMKLFTWGQANFRIRTPTLQGISERFYGGYAFPRFKAG